MQLPKFLEQPNPSLFLTNKYLVLDFETTNKNKGDFTLEENSIVLAVAKSGITGEVSVFWGNEFEMGDLLSLIKKHDFVVAQNAKFELGWLQRAGQDLTKIIMYDTILGKYTQNGNRRSSLDLNSLADFYGLGERKEDVVSRLISFQVPTEQIPASWLEEYCKKDVLITEEVFLIQREQLLKENLLPVFYTKCMFIPPLTDIESNGMCLDKERVEKVHRKFEREFIESKKEFDIFTKGINQNSNKQVADYLYNVLRFKQLRDYKGNIKYTDGGNPKTDEKTILALKATTKRQEEFKNLYIKTVKLGNKLTKYLSKLKECCEVDDGILNANFNMAITKTHRLSSSGKKYKIQFQNMDKKLKPLFTARYKGWSMGEGDEAQLEFRAAAFLGNDPVAIRDIEGGVDVHSFTASVLTEAGQSTDRDGAKEHTFKPLYGGSSGTNAEQEYYKTFKEKYNKIAETQDHWVELVLKEKELTLPTGFKFYWDDTKITRSGYVINTTSIYNYPVQHFATAEIVPIAVTHLWHRMKMAKMKSFLVNTVHDSAQGEIHAKEHELWTALVKQAMTSDVVSYLKELYGIELNVPLEADVSIGTHWAEKEGWTEKFL